MGANLEHLTLPGGKAPGPSTGACGDTAREAAAPTRHRFIHAGKQSCSARAKASRYLSAIALRRGLHKAYIKSQAHEGWRLIPDHYDEGGLSGASLDRPALHCEPTNSH